SESIQVLPTTVVEASPIDIFDIPSAHSTSTFSFPSIPPPPGFVPRLGNYVAPTNPRFYMVHPAPGVLRRDQNMAPKEVTDWSLLKGPAIIRSTIVGIAVAVAYYRGQGVADAAVKAFLGHAFWGPVL